MQYTVVNTGIATVPNEDQNSLLVRVTKFKLSSDDRSTFTPNVTVSTLNNIVYTGSVSGYTADKITLVYTLNIPSGAGPFSYGVLGLYVEENGEDVLFAVAAKDSVQKTAGTAITETANVSLINSGSDLSSFTSFSLTNEIPVKTVYGLDTEIYGNNDVIATKENFTSVMRKNDDAWDMDRYVPMYEGSVLEVSTQDPILRTSYDRIASLEIPPVNLIEQPAFLTGNVYDERDIFQLSDILSIQTVSTSRGATTATAVIESAVDAIRNSLYDQSSTIKHTPVNTDHDMYVDEDGNLVVYTDVASREDTFTIKIQPPSINSWEDWTDVPSGTAFICKIATVFTKNVDKTWTISALGDSSTILISGNRQESHDFGVQENDTILYNVSKSNKDIIHICFRLIKQAAFTNADANLSVTVAQSFLDITSPRASVDVRQLDFFLCGNNVLEGNDSNFDTPNNWVVGSDLLVNNDGQIDVNRDENTNPIIRINTRYVQNAFPNGRITLDITNKVRNDAQYSYWTAYTSDNSGIVAVVPLDTDGNVLWEGARTDIGSGRNPIGTPFKVKNSEFKTLAFDIVVNQYTTRISDAFLQYLGNAGYYPNTGLDVNFLPYDFHDDEYIVQMTSGKTKGAIRSIKAAQYCLLEFNERLDFIPEENDTFIIYKKKGAS